MRKQCPSKAWVGIARIAALGVCAVLVAGCATGYSYVQPNLAGSGSYYTGNEPYSGEGYYDIYGTGPYYPGTSGWGYYNGTGPWWNGLGWYGGYGGYYGAYFGYGYWPGFTFGLGFSNVWDFPGYWGPWYTGFPLWSCAGPGCGYLHHHRHHGRHHRHGWDTSRSWLTPGHTPVPRRIARNGPPPIEALSRMPARPTPEDFANRRALAPAAFAPHAFVRAPIQRPAATGFDAMPASPAFVPRSPELPAFVSPRALSMPMPRGVRPMPQPAFRAPPMPVAPMIAPPPRHHSGSTKTEIR